MYKKSIYYCNNTNCEDHISEEKETKRNDKYAKETGKCYNWVLSGCDWMNPKGTKRCDKRKNPTGIKCQSCEGTHHVVYTKLGYLCQHCRGSYTNQLHLIQRLGGQPRLASNNQKIDNIY